MRTSVPEDIHYLAGVPADLNPDLYKMTEGMILAAMDRWEKAGLSLNEQRHALDKEKDHLVRELVILKEKGIARTGEEGQPRSAPRVVRMADVRKAGQ